MFTENFSSLHISRFELRLRARESVSLPPFLGSTVRGAFGHSLKHAVCIMPHRNCERCTAADRCLYPYLFETPVPPGLTQLRGQERAPHPFILSPPAVGAPPAKRAVSPATAQPGAMGGDWSARNRGSSAPAAPVLREAQRIDTASREALAHEGLKSGAGVSITTFNTPRENVPASESRYRQTAPARDGFRNGWNGGDASVDRRLNLDPGDEVTFGLTLMGRAVEYLPYLIYAVTEMSRRGLGVDRARFELTEALVIGPDGGKQRIYSGDCDRVNTPADSATSLSALIQARVDRLRSDSALNSESLRLRFATPTRIRVDGDLQSGMSFGLLVRNLLRRISLLCAVHGQAPLDLDYRGLIERAALVETASSRLRWCDWERYSNRQQTKMKLGGFVGEIEYDGEISREFLSLMVAGEILHVGAGTSFGLGRYEILA